MTRKPASMYRPVRGQAYTRREFMGGVPGSTVVHYDMGNKTQTFPVSVSILVEEACQIRHSALEAARVAANRYLTRELGVTNYHFKLRVYPHNVLRENKQATGAGADRVSDGMRHSFGKVVGTAARVQRGQKVFTVSTDPRYFNRAKEALRRAGSKLPAPCRIVVDEGANLIQT